MSRSAIKRPVVTMDTSNQRSLFDELPEPAVKNEPLPEAPDLTGIEFQDPDPRRIRLNEVRLDRHLEQTHQTAALKVRALLAEIDWTSFESSYRPGGRPAYAPRAMMGLILYGIMQGVSSLRRLETFARTDLGCMWISGGILPDHSVIGRFVQRHDTLLSGEFFAQLTASVLKATGSSVDTVAGDGSIIEAAASRFAEVKAEALAAAIATQREKVEALQHQQTGEAPQSGPAEKSTPSEAEVTHQQHRLDTLLEAQRTLEARQQRRQNKGKPGQLCINHQEPDAVIQPQKDKKRFAASYKPSVLVNEMRIILGQAVDPANEGIVVGPLLEQAKRHGQIRTALFDAGYFNEQVIDTVAAHEIELLCPEGRSQGKDWNKQSDKRYPKSHFDYDPEQDHYRCPQGEVLHYLHAYKGNDNTPGYRLYGSKACGQCAHRAACTQSAKGRQIKRYASDDAKDALRKKMQDPEIRGRYCKRQGMVEPVFGHLRYQQGLNRFRRKGLAGVRLEFSLHALAYNLSRAVAQWADAGLYIVRFMALSWLKMSLSTIRPVLRQYRGFSGIGVFGWAI